MVLEKNQFKFKPGTYASVCSLNNKNTHLSATCIYNNKHHQIAETFILDRKLKSYKYALLFLEDINNIIKKLSSFI